MLSNEIDSQLMLENPHHYFIPPVNFLSPQLDKNILRVRTYAFHYIRVSSHLYFFIQQ